MPSSAIGIDIGGSAIKAARVDDRGRLDGLMAVSTPAAVSAIADYCGSLAIDLMSDDVVAVGIGSAGYVDRRQGIHVWGPHVGGPVPLAAAVIQATKLPVAVENDANAAALAELRLGAASGHSSAVVVNLGTGIGGGVIAGGVVYRGRGFAGEIGHLVLDPDGPECECGRRGCWEKYVSGSVLDATARRLGRSDPHGAVARHAGGRTPTGEHLLMAARDGDEAALDEWAVVGRWLGYGIGQIATVLDPEVVVVGGGPAAAGDLLLGPAREALSKIEHGAVLGRNLPVLGSRFGQNGALVGAGLMALEYIDE